MLAVDESDVVVSSPSEESGASVDSPVPEPCVPVAVEACKALAPAVLSDRVPPAVATLVSELVEEEAFEDGVVEVSSIVVLFIGFAAPGLPAMKPATLPCTVRKPTSNTTAVDRFIESGSLTASDDAQPLAAKSMYIGYSALSVSFY